VSAHRVGKLVIAPPWLGGEFDPITTIVIDPAMAFGTGEHPTTRGVMRLMQGVIGSGDVVADLGAGSAVLSIAAAKLGARRVTAIEIDPDSIGNAEKNVRVNGVGEIVEVIEGDAATLLPLLAPVRVVLANIISSALITLLPTIRASLDARGQAILSGILREERESMLAALDSDGWTAEREDTEDAWWSVQIAPR
jgi:ribosomal protein L11 methyltransferase